MKQQRLTEALSHRNQIGFIKPALVIFLCGAVFVGGVYLSIAGPYANNESDDPALQKSDATVETFEIDTSGIIGGQSLSVGGQLRVNNTLVLNPSSQPAQTSAGQIYFDAGAKEIRYYDGTSFQGIASTGDVEAALEQQPPAQQPGTGSASQNITNITQQTINNYETATGEVTQAGNNTFTGENSFTDISVEDFTASGAAALQGSLTVTGTTLLGPASASSLLLSSALDVSSGGTGRDTFNTNEIVIGQGTGALATITNGAPGLCLLSTAGAPSFQACPGGGGSSGVSSLAGLTGDLLVANSSTSGSTITIDTATSTNRGLASFNATNLTVTAGSVNTVQNIAVTAAPTFAGITVNGLINGQTLSSTASLTGTLSVAGATTATGGIITNSIVSASGLSVGSSAQTLSLQGGASSTFSATSGANTTTLQFQTPTANANYRFATATAGTYDVCTTVGNCVGVGGSVSTSGGTNGQIAKFDSSNNIVDSLLSESGVTVTADGHFNIAAGSQYQIDGVQISSSVLSNDSSLAKLNASQTFSGQTIFRNTVDSSAALSLQNAAGNDLATLNTTNGSFELGDSSTLDGKLVVRNATNNFTVTVNASNPTGNHTVSLGNESGTICLQNSGGCGFITGAAANANYVQNQNSAQQAGGNFWIAGTGRADTVLQAPVFDAASSGALTLGGANATSISVTQNTTLAASKALTITGGATGTRPAVPAEGMVYYDTTTKQLITYANGKWQADRSASTKIVAANNSSQSAKDAADYVADGSGDQVEINAALTAAAGGKVYLMEGTYVAGATILVPNNTMLTGAGRGTLIELADIDVADNLIESSDQANGTGVVIQDLRLDGRKDLNTAGTQRGIYLVSMGGGSGATARQGGRISNVIINNMRSEGVYLSGSNGTKLMNNTILASGSYGIQLSGTDYGTVTGNLVQGGSGDGILIGGGSENNTVSNNTVQGNTSAGITVSTSSMNTFAGNVITGGSYGFAASIGSSNNTFTGNTLTGGNTTGINISSSSVNNAIVGNTITSYTSYGIDLSATGATVSDNTISGIARGMVLTGDQMSITGNTISTASLYGINLNSLNNSIISNNRISDSGGSTTNNGIYLSSSDSNSIFGNHITDSSATTNNYAINISNSASDTNVLGDNALGTGSISDTGTSTRYQAQTNAAGNLLIQPAGTIELMKDTNVTGALAVSGNATVTGGTLTVGAVAQQGSLAINDGSGNTATIQVGNLAGNYVYTIPVTTASDTFCMLVAANCSGGGVTAIGALDGGTANATGATITGSTLFLQSASGTNPGLVNTAAQTFAGDKTFTGTLSVQDVTVGAGKSIYVTGGATGTRPGTPTEGMVYFDTTIKQLITYANGKWQADRSSSTVLVAASNSKNKDAADFVVSSADETAGNADVAINAAIAALPVGGGTVYLMEGTYTIDTAITLWSNTTLAGSGNGSTILKLKNAHNLSIDMVSMYNTAYKNNITIRDLQIDGNSANQTAGTQEGIHTRRVGRTSGSYNGMVGLIVDSVSVKNMRGNGIYFEQTAHSKITNSYFTGNTGAGINDASNTAGTGNVISNNTVNTNTAQGIIAGGDSSIVSGNVVTGNGASGIYLTAPGAKVLGNTIQTNTGYGVFISVDNVEVTDNTISGNTSYGIFVDASGAQIDGNKITSNGTAGISMSLGEIETRITNNTINSNTGNGIQGERGNSNTTITGNTIKLNTAWGVVMSGYIYQTISNLTVNNNYVSSNASGGIQMWSAQESNIVGNTVSDNGGATGNNGILIANISGNINVSNNSINDTSCTTNCYAIDVSGGLDIYLSNNTIGDAARGSTTYGTFGYGVGEIRDTGVRTIYVNQRDAHGNLINRGGAALTINTSTVNSSLTLQGGFSNIQLSTPAQPTVANVGTAGTTTYGYRVTALDGTGETLPSTERTTTTGNAILNATNYNTITWDPVSGAVQYKIYRTTSAGTPASTGLIGTVTGGTTVSFNDIGIAGGAAAPGSNTSGGMSIAGAIQGSSANLTGGLTVAGASTLNGTLTATGVALFKNTANSATAFQIQDSSSNVLFSADTTAAKITVRTLDVTFNLTVAGHIISGGSTPAIAADTAACTSPTVNVSGTDTAGVITVTTGTGCAAPGLLSSVTFATAFGAAPKVTLTPASAAAAALNGYVDDASLSTTTFKIGAVNTPLDATVYKWHYHALQ